MRRASRTAPTGRAPRVTLVLKTNEGGLWVVPQLLALRAAGADVTAVIPPGSGRLRTALDTNAVRVVDSPFDFTFSSARSVRGLWRLRRTLSRTRPDVVFYHLYASALAARLATLGRRVRRVHMVAGPLYLESPTIRRVERVLMRLDHHLIAGSRFTADRYAELGYPTHRLSAVPYGVDLHHFAPTDDASPATDGSTALENFVVVMVAYVYAPKSAVFPGVGIKGHDILLEAWRDFRAARPEAHLVLVGSGFDEVGEEHRRYLIERYRIADDPSIEWVERVDDVRSYYERADVSVSPSLSENHGAVLEASAMRVPSIVSSAGALPEAVTSESGWVVPVGNAAALTEALVAAAAEKDSGSLALRGAAARRHMQDHFDVEVCATRVVERVLD